MKKLFLFLLCLILLCFTLCSCGKLSQENYETGIDVLEVADYYIDGLIDSNTAVSAFNIYAGCVTDTDGKLSNQLQTIIHDLNQTLTSEIQNNNPDHSDLIEKRNALAAFLKEPLR